MNSASFKLKNINPPISRAMDLNLPSENGFSRFKNLLIAG